MQQQSTDRASLQLLQPHPHHRLTLAAFPAGSTSAKRLLPCPNSHISQAGTIHGPCHEGKQIKKLTWDLFVALLVLLLVLFVFFFPFNPHQVL